MSWYSVGVKFLQIVNVARELLGVFQTMCKVMSESNLTVLVVSLSAVW